MTYMTHRGTSILLRWRFAGKHQCCTFRQPASIKAIAAKHYIESRHHQVTSAQVYAAIDPDSPGAVRMATPLLRDWIERWIQMKIDVASGTHYEYAQLLRRRVVGDLGDLRVGDITRHDHLDPWKTPLANCVQAARSRSRRSNPPAKRHRINAAAPPLGSRPAPSPR